MSANLKNVVLIDKGKVVGGDTLRPHLVISATTGATVIVKKGVKAVRATETSTGVFECDVTEFGTWVVSSSLNYSVEVVVEVVVDTVKLYSVDATAVVYGFKVDSTVSSSDDAVSYKVQYNGKNVNNYNYSPAYMDFTNDRWVWGSWSENDFFMPRPVLISQDYATKIYLNPNDLTKDTSGNDVSSYLTGASGSYNAMMEWGKDGKQIWYKVIPDTNDDTTYTVLFANKKMDNDFVAWSFYDANDNLIEHFYTGIYGACAESNVLRSLSGKTRNNTTAGATQIAYAKANNQNGEEYAWYIDVFADRILINFLLILVIKSLNSEKIGYGHAYNGSSASDIYATGLGNDKGYFYGKRGNQGCKIFGMENWYADAWRRMAGYVLSSGTVLYKLTYGTADGSSLKGYIENDNAPTNYLTGNTIATNVSGSFIKKMKAYSNGIILVSAYAGGNGTYYSDSVYTSSGVCFANVGGGCNNGSDAGAFAINVNGALSVTFWSVGVGLSLKPLAS